MGQNPLLIVIKFVKKHLKLLASTFGAVLIIVYLFLKIFITPEYTSEAIIYPANIHPVSSEDQTEQVLQILRSADIKAKMIDSFKLIERYGFNKERVNYSNLSKKYDRKVLADRTPFSSIQILVQDENPQMAADMANALIKLLDSKILRMRRQKYKEWATTARQKYEDKLGNIASLQEKLRIIKTDNKIVNLSEQSAIVSTKLNRALNILTDAQVKIEAFKKYSSSAYRDSVRKYEVVMKSASTKSVALQEQFDNILKVGDEITGIEQSLEFERESLAEYKIELDEAEQNAKRKITYSFIVSNAGAADQPAYPKKVLTAFVTAVSASFMLMLFLVLLQQYNSLKPEL